MDKLSHAARIYYLLAASGSKTDLRQALRISGRTLDRVFRAADPLSPRIEARVAELERKCPIDTLIEAKQFLSDLVSEESDRLWEQRRILAEQRRFLNRILHYVGDRRKHPNSEAYVDLCRKALPEMIERFGPEVADLVTRHGGIHGGMRDFIDEGALSVQTETKAPQDAWEDLCDEDEPIQGGN